MAAAALLKGLVIPQERSISSGESRIVHQYAISFMDSGNPEVVTLLRTIEAMEREGLSEVERVISTKAIGYIEAYRDNLVGCADCASATGEPALSGVASDPIGRDEAIEAILQNAERPLVAE
jgi:hypothetical protein